MNAPTTCPFCKSSVMILESGKPCRADDDSWVVFDCMTSIHAGQHPRRIQSRLCEQSERDALAARVATLEATLASNHGGEPLALLNELDQAREENRDLAAQVQQLKEEIERLRKGLTIG